MAWNKGEMSREQYDEAMAEMARNPEGIEYPASGPAPALVETQARTIAGTDIVDLPTVYKSIIEVLQALGDNAVLRTGRYAGPATGLYKEFENVIRLRKGMDREGLPVVVHELGHSMAKSIFGTAKSSALKRGNSLAANNAVLENVRAGARQHGRVYALMYDLSSLAPGQADVLIADWKKTAPRYPAHERSDLSAPLRQTAPCALGLRVQTRRQAPPFARRLAQDYHLSQKTTKRVVASRSCSACPAGGAPSAAMRSPIRRSLNSSRLPK